MGQDATSQKGRVKDAGPATPHHPGDYLPSRVIKRSIVVGRHKTSVSLEDVFWVELRKIAEQKHLTLSRLVAEIDAKRQHSNLSSAIRLFVFDQRVNSAH